MLKQRILATLKFFDLQDYPLTLLELHRYLVVEPKQLKAQINTEWELITSAIVPKISLGELLVCLDDECQGLVEYQKGFYCLSGRRQIIDWRWRNFLFGLKREKLIRKFIGNLKFIPFVRGVALAGSQAMGLQKAGSDIDLLIIVRKNFLWLARTGITVYFQLLRNRRHGLKIANRFCLNHYLAGPLPINQLKNLYTAWEYAKLRPLVFFQEIGNFQKNNLAWLQSFFPQVECVVAPKQPQPKLQAWLETIFNNRFGQWLELRLKAWQLPKIRQESFIIVTETELSFHPQSKQQGLLQRFFI